MRPLSRLTLVAMLAALALANAAARAVADADPPSDYLLTQDVYLPFQPRVSKPLAVSLQATVARAKQANYPLKVALIGGEPDLGAVPNMFNKPDTYAPFLARELGAASVPTLVVMPEGLSVANATPTAAKAVQDVDVAKDDKADGLARAAIEAVPKMATASGHPVPPTKLPPATKDGAGISPLIVFGAPVALVALAALVVGLRRRRAHNGDEDDEDEPAPASTETGGGSSP